jgi:hypothetical protein
LAKGVFKMNKNVSNVLKNRHFKITGNWYAPLKKLQEYPSVIHAEHIETTSSAGDWTGIFFQKIGRKTYIIPFSQENGYPRHSGYDLYTGDVFGSYKGEVTQEDIKNAIEDFCNVYYK